MGDSCSSEAILAPSGVKYATQIMMVSHRRMNKRVKNCTIFGLCKLNGFGSSTCRYHSESNGCDFVPNFTYCITTLTHGSIVRFFIFSVRKNVKDKQTGAEQKLDDGFKSGGLGGGRSGSGDTGTESRRSGE